MSETSTSAIHAARGLVRDAQRIAVLTGAGMSAESGVPTYRDARTGFGKSIHRSNWLPLKPWPTSRI